MRTVHLCAKIQRSLHDWRLGCLTLTFLLVATSAALAVGPKALPEGGLPDDVRLGELKDLNGYFPFVVPDAQGQWQARAAALRRQVLVSQGLWPMPSKGPLRTVIHGCLDQGDYTIEKVYFESMPGLFVTGNLYRPKDRPGPHAGVLCPHGHWANGRFYDCGEKEVRKQIVQGAERFADGGRSPMQSRCVQLARMGCVVFHYDMLGYADSQQLARGLIHGFSEQRPAMNNTDQWGLFSPQAESRLQSAMGLQTFHSIRSLDFLLSLPDVDQGRIAITGASGGGTQSFILSAIDPRLQVSFPAVMVSTAMQGGCTCENACCLRVGTGNIELAALFAPKPLGLTAADDWTLEMPTKGLPELKQLYRLLSTPDNVKLTALPHFGHNYNYVSRAAMYSWLNQHLQLGLPDPIVEEGYQRLSSQELTVWDDQHPQPAGGDELERRILTWWDRDSCQQLAALRTSASGKLEAYQTVIRQALKAIIARPMPQADRIDLKTVSQRSRQGTRETVGLLTYRLPPSEAVAANQAGQAKEVQEQLPVVLLEPSQPCGEVCVMALPGGKSGLFDDRGTVRSSIRKLLDEGITVCAADLLYQGEFLEAGRERIEKTRRVDNRREAAAYTFGYNPTLLAHRVRDLLTIVAHLRADQNAAKEITLAGLGECGPIVAIASGLAPDEVRQVAVDQADFRFAAVDDLHSPMFLPGGAKYDDLPGILVLSAPKPLWLGTSQPQPPRVVAKAYEASQQGHIACYGSDDGDKIQAIVRWLLRD